MRNFLSKLISAKEPPFVIATLLAGITWSTSQIVDRTLAEPLIVYRTYTVADDKSSTHEVHYSVHNVSRERNFHNLWFYVTTGHDPKLTFTDAEYKADPGIISNRWNAKNDARSASLYVSDLPPDGRFEFIISSSAGFDNLLRVESRDSNYVTVSDPQAILLEKTSYATLLVEYYTYILFAITFAWIALLVVSLITIVTSD